MFKGRRDDFLIDWGVKEGSLKEVAFAGYIDLKYKKIGGRTWKKILKLDSEFSGMVTHLI